MPKVRSKEGEPLQGKRASRMVPRLGVLQVLREEIT